MDERLSCFVAYASTIPGNGDALEAAIEEIQAGGVVDIKGWRSLSMGGNLVVDKICEEICARDILIADVTLLNPNVLFELGYGIAKGKLIWILYDPSLSQASADFDKFQILTTLGYNKYSNSTDITTAFYREQPYSRDKEPLLTQLSRQCASRDQNPSLLYVKPEVVTEAVKLVARRISSSPIPPTIDDPEEIRFHSPSWYTCEVQNSFAVVCRFMSDDHKGAKLNNARNALVAGLAYGFNRPLLMLAHEPYSSPIDYRDLLRRHHDAKTATGIYDEWALRQVRDYTDRIQAREQYKEARAKNARLSDIYLGEPIAEQESQALEDYFIKTSAFGEALHSDYSIFVGRRGSGKTAMLYKIAAELEADPRNHVALIMPASYELEGLTRLLKDRSAGFEKGYLVESFWKFLIYTELAKSVYERLLLKPTYYQKTAAESRLADFVAARERLIMPEFSARLETAIRTVSEADLSEAAKSQSRISEQLHAEMLSELRAVLGSVFRDRNSVSVLVDNLDKSWTSSSDLQLTSELLLGLMSVGNQIAEEFRRSASGRESIKMKMIIFIRTDIFATISQSSQERDKLPARRIDWTDSELLIRVIEERFLQNGISTTQRIWADFFGPSVGGVPTRKFLTDNVFPRPRDLIVLTKASMEAAVNRGDPRIEERDLLAGIRQYSAFAYNALVVEGKSQFPKIEDVLFQLMEGPDVLSEYQLLEVLERVSPEYDVERFIEFLADLTFLGFEVRRGEFSFIHDFVDRTKVEVRAKKVAEEYKERRYKVHPAFKEFLELRSNSE